MPDASRVVPESRLNGLDESGNAGGRTGPVALRTGFGPAAFSERRMRAGPLVDPPELPRRAFDLACRLHLPTASDACYLALTEIGGGGFWTANERLYPAIRDAFPAIHRLGEAL
jgi:hypothetical protein